MLTPVRRNTSKRRQNIAVTDHIHQKPVKTYLYGKPIFVTMDSFLKVRLDKDDKLRFCLFYEKYTYFFKAANKIFWIFIAK